MRHRERLGSCLAGKIPSAGRQLVIAARRSLFLAGEAVLLPLRPDAALRIEPSEDWIDGAARQPGRVHDVEAVMAAIEEGLEYERGGVGQSHRRSVLPM